MKVGIVGSGFVGATAAYAMIMNGTARHIVLVDKNEERARAEAADILHAVPFAHAGNISAGDYQDLVGCQAVIMSAGVSQRPGETRLQLLERNTAVFQAVIPQIYRYAPETILIVATNPVDIMTHISAKIAAQFNIPSQRVIGSGTTLDTARYRALLAQALGVDATHVHGYVIGEHGDSEILTWSLTTIGNLPLNAFCEMRNIDLCSQKRKDIDHNVRNAAYQIIAGKGATYYGVGAALARIVRNVLQDRRAIMTVCTPKAEISGVPDVTVSLPHLVGGAGVLETFPLPLNEAEEAGLRNSAQIIRQAISQLEV